MGRNKWVDGRRDRLKQILNALKNKEFVNDYRDRWTDKDLAWAYKLGLKKGSLKE